MNIGDTVRVVHPTGGVLIRDRFRIVPTPEGKDPKWTWVKYVGKPRWNDHFTQPDARPMGFDPGSLELAAIEEGSTG